MDGRDESVPYAYGMYAAIVYAQPMFIPRTRNIYPRTPTFIPRTPTVMRDCIYIIRADGRDESAPTPTECTLLLFMYNQYLHHEHVIFTHVHQRLPTCTHCRGRFIVPEYYGMHGVDILCFICFVFHLCHSICALMIFVF